MSDLTPRERYEALFTGTIDDGKRQIALGHALDIRKFEIALYWTRATYFWTFIGAALVAYGAVRTLPGTEKNDFSVFVSCLGFLFSFAWYCVNRGSKYWQENWENHVDLLEDSVAGPLYKVVIRRAPAGKWYQKLGTHLTGPHPFSVSKINQIISLYVTGFWVLLVWYSLESSVDISAMYVAVVVLTALAASAFVTLGRTHRSSHRIVAEVRETILDGLEPRPKA
ncbi:MAG TPA: hypothetical protein VHG93_03650 [Longimicrobium sp.]|nr:hypothetical protein [Longimicrobium sp.]